MFFLFLFLFKEILENLIFLLCCMVLVIWMIFNFMSNKNYNNLVTVNLILFIIITFFNTIKLWKFFLVYEASIIPIVILLLSWGINPSRLPATLYMIIYMCMFSFPSLLVIMKNLKIFFSNLFICSIVLNFLSKFIIILMFIVKIPMFFFHYWLPKAHTEASTVGSMILASGLLKMGSFGLWKMMKFIQFNSLNYFMVFLLSLMSCFICLLQTDIKKMIALMSVYHMTMSISTLMVMNLASFWGFIYLNITHIFSSSALFYFSGLMYGLTKTRLLFMMKMIPNSKQMVLLILILLMNMSIPPFFSFFVEILNLSMIFFKNFLVLLVILLMLIFNSMMNIFIMNMMKMFINKSMKLMSFILFYYIFYNMLFMWFMI